MRKHTGWILAAALAGMALQSGNVAAQLYQWRDTNGKMVFSDAPPPPNIPAGNIIKSPKGKSAAAPAEAPKAADAKAPAPAAGKSVAEREAEYKKRQAEAAEKASKDEQAAADERRRQETCKGLRENLAPLESGQRVRAGGEFIDDAERARRIENTRKQLADNKC